MSTRQIADDIWYVELTTAKKTAYVGMIKLVEGEYRAVRDGRTLGAGKSLEEAEKFFE